MAQRFEIFNKENLGSIRTAVVDGEPWFCLKDACDILGLKQPVRVKERLNEKGVISIHTLTKGGCNAFNNKISFRRRTINRFFKISFKLHNVLLRQHSST